MARRDVDLVIRAKDEAEKVIQSITAALNDFTDAQVALDSRSAKTDSSLGRLGSAVAELDKAFSSFSSGKGIDDKIEQSIKNIARFETNIESTKGALAGLTRSSKAVADVQDQYAAKLARATAAQQKQTDSVSRAKASAKELQGAYSDTEKAIGRMETRFAKLPELIQKQVTTVTDAERRFNEYADAIRDTDQPSKTLQTNFERTGRILGEQRAKLQGLDTELTELRGKLNAAGSASVFFSDQSERATIELARQERILAGIGGSVSELTQKNRQAGNAQQRLGTQLRNTKNDLDRQTASLEKAEAAFVDTTVSAKEFQQVLARGAQVSSSGLEQQLVEQGIAAQRAKAEVSEYEAVLSKLRAGTAEIGPPTREMSQAIGLAAANAEEARFKYLLQEESLERLGAAFRETGSDISSIAATQARFLAEQNRLGGAMSEVANDALRERNAIRQLNSVQSQAAITSERMERATRGTATATGTAAANTSRLAAAYRVLYGDSRKALSIQQRLRGEVLSLVAAYGGLYGVIDLMGRVLTATQTLEGATARLNVANDGNLAQTGEDMDFLRRTADRLGIELGVLATEFSKFSIATQGTALAGENTRKIFIAVAEAARVNRSSTQEMQGVFTALTQIVSKGCHEAGTLIMMANGLTKPVEDVQPGDSLMGPDGMPRRVLKTVRGRSMMIRIVPESGDPFVVNTHHVLPVYAGDGAAPQYVMAYDLLAGVCPLGYLNRIGEGLVAYTVEKAPYDDYFGFAIEGDRLYLDGQSFVQHNSVQMEELRQQLGDRLPGALQLMADGLKVTTAELINMMEQGEVGAEALVPFAEELQERFGPGLAESLKGTTVQIGRLKNAAFEAAITFGRGGFLESFNALAADLVTLLKSADFAAFLNSASSAMAFLLDVIAAVVRNFELFVAAAGLFVGLKLAKVVLAMGEAFTKAKTAAIAASGAVSTAGAAAGTAAGSIGRARVAVLGLTAGLRALLASTGIGLLIAGIGAGIGYWASTADEASEALAAHRELVDKVKNAYDAVGGSVDEWREKVNDLTEQEAAANVRRVTAAVEDLNSALDFVSGGNDSFLTNFFGFNLASGTEIFNVASDYKAAVRDVISSYRDGELGADGFIRKLDEVAGQFDDGSEESNQYAVAVIKAAKAIVEGNLSLEEASNVLTAVAEDGEDAQEAFDELGNKAAEAAVEVKTLSEKSKDFNSAMGELQSKVPEVARELERLGEIDAIDKLTASAIEAATSMTQVEAALRAAAEAKDALNSDFNAQSISGLAAGDTGVEASAALLREFEGFRATPYFDVNAQRVGFGSDTITLADGSIQKVVKGMRVSVADANRDLLRRVGQEFLPKARNQVGAERFDTFGPQQQAALTSIAYNYGTLPDRIIGAVRTGTDAEVAAAIRGLGGDNDGVNRSRRNKEAALFESGGGIENQIKFQARLDADAAKEREEAAEAAQKKREEQQEFIDAQQASVEQSRFEASIQNDGLVARETATALREAELEAQKVGLTLTQAQRDAIKEATAAKFQQKAADEASNATKQKAAEAEQKVNDLLSQRRDLTELLKIATENGDTSKAEELKTGIAGINEQLIAAIENAKQMWAAVGGSSADTAISKLEVAKVQAENLSVSADNNYLKWDRVAGLFVNGLSSAFDTFAQSVAEGQSVGEAARNAFLKFASDFLLQIARMIIQQAIFNALRSAFGGTSFGSLIGLPTGHTGGLVGSSRVGSGNSTRQVNPAAFAGAMRYHVGGLAGMRPGEVPIIAKQNEEILTRDDPRHMLNGGLGGGGQSADGGTTIINTFDPEEVMDRALSTRRGAKVLVNAIRGSRTEVKAAIG